MILLAVFLQMSECILTPDGLMQPPGMKIFESTANFNRQIFEYSQIKVVYPILEYFESFCKVSTVNHFYIRTAKKSKLNGISIFQPQVNCREIPRHKKRKCRLFKSSNRPTMLLETYEVSTDFFSQQLIFFTLTVTNLMNDDILVVSSKIYFVHKSN